MFKKTATEYTSYYPDGKLESKAEVVNGNRHGQYVRSAHNGNIYAKGRMKFEDIDGTTEYYDTISGKLEKYVNHVILKKR